MIYAFDVSVYVELVIFNNFLLDLLLIYSTQSLRRRNLNIWRGVLSSLIGAICATAYPIVPNIAQIIIKILSAPIMCAVAFSPQGEGIKYKLGDYLGTLIIFVLLTFFTGGIIYGLSYAFKVDLKSYAILGLMALSVIMLIASVKLIARKRSCATKATCETTVQFAGRAVSVQALCDSGNLLVDDVSGLPVVILSQGIEDRLGARKLAGFINVSTVNGEDSLALVSLDGINVNGKEFKALGALSHQNFGNFDIILQNSMF